jgi:alkanesulfonate monooxygenase SsuD/methylene tetrahydromethanopterin reductase-like flavin-dependent oxidoreductase (luciferase family)
MGWDHVWFVEHHFLTGFSMSPCPEVIFGALSRLTKRIRLGFGVVILSYHHPVRVAERVAMVDHLSNGGGNPRYLCLLCRFGWVLPLRAITLQL